MNAPRLIGWIVLCVVLGSGSLCHTQTHMETSHPWFDDYYQYRLRIEIQTDRPGWHILPIDEAEITRAWNRIEEMRFDPTFFAYNDVKVIETQPDGVPVDLGGRAGFFVVPEGEGKEGFTGMGYMTIDRDKCTGLDLCGRCLEVCEDQFASGISFDPIEGKAQICTMCGGLPACEEACPEPTALQFVPLMTNGRYFANPPEAYMELVYAKIFGKRRDL